MPRVQPLNAKEAGICQRVKSFRESTKLSRVAFSNELGIDSSELVRVEHLRTPLRFETGRRICVKFKISPDWLATGEGSIDGGFIFPDAEFMGLHKKALFSEAYEKFAPEVAEMRKAGFTPYPSGTKLEVTFGEGVDARLNAEHHLQNTLRKWLQEIPDAKIDHFANKLLAFAGSLLNSYPADPRTIIAKRIAEMERKRAALNTWIRIPGVKVATSDPQNTR